MSHMGFALLVFDYVMTLRRPAGRHNLNVGTFLGDYETQDYETLYHGTL